MNVLPFPVHQIRSDAFVEYRINRIKEEIEAKQREMAKIAHDIWLLKLEKEGLSNER